MVALGRVEPATWLKYTGRTAARMVVAKAEFAQSYIVQAQIRFLYNLGVDLGNTRCGNGSHNVSWIKNCLRISLWDGSNYSGIQALAEHLFSGSRTAARWWT